MCLYRNYLTPSDIPEVVFLELMEFTTTSVEFSFDNIMYRQVEGILMDSALGPTMAGIFVGFHEVNLFSRYKAPEVYFRYVDDTFCVFGSDTKAGEFFSHLNSMHPALTLEKENNSTLPFLNVLVCKETSVFLGLVGRVFANGPGDLGSIPGRVIPKTLKMILDTSLLNTQ